MVNILVEGRQSYDGIADQLDTVQGRAIAVLGVDYLNGECAPASLGKRTFETASSMNGKQIYNQIQQAAEGVRVGAPERAYAQTLRTAARVVDSEKLYALLQQAEESGKRLRLTYPIDPDLGVSEPNAVELV